MTAPHGNVDANPLLEAQLAEIFGVTLVPSADTTELIYDQIAASLADDAFRPRALYERFGISVLATADDPCADLGAHAALTADPAWQGRVIPIFRPDRYLEPAQGGWAEAVARLGATADVDTGDYAAPAATLRHPPGLPPGRLHPR